MEFFRTVFFFFFVGNFEIVDLFCMIEKNIPRWINFKPEIFLENKNQQKKV